MNVRAEPEWPRSLLIRLLKVPHYGSDHLALEGLTANNSLRLRGLTRSSRQRTISLGLAFGTAALVIADSPAEGTRL
jgi:hypothetical protein